MNSWELVGQMPGIQLTETRMGAESGKVTFRAFNGEGYTVSYTHLTLPTKA